MFIISFFILQDAATKNKSLDSEIKAKKDPAKTKYEKQMDEVVQKANVFYNKSNLQQQQQQSHQQQPQPQQQRPHQQQKGRPQAKQSRRNKQAPRRWFARTNNNKSR